MKGTSEAGFSQSGWTAEVLAELDQLKAELDECAIWLDSSYGPSPRNWTDEMWNSYLKSRQPVQVAE